MNILMLHIKKMILDNKILPEDIPYLIAGIAVALLLGLSLLVSVCAVVIIPFVALLSLDWTKLLWLIPDIIIFSIVAGLSLYIIKWLDEQDY